MFIMCCMVGWKALFSPEAFRITAGLSPPHAEGAKKENGRFVPLFGFANGLLAFLALAAVLDFCPCCGTGAPLLSGGARNDCCSPRAMLGAPKIRCMGIFAGRDGV